MEIFCPIENATKMFLDGQALTEKYTLKHNQGQVMSILFWASWHIHSLSYLENAQLLLEEHAHDWRDKVRMLCLSTDLTTVTPPKFLQDS
jgi:hypothetical protein